MIYIIISLMGISIFFSGLSLWQAKGLAEYLRSKGANSEDKAIELPKDIKRKYILAVPIFSGMLLKVTKDKKYWVN